MVILLFFVLTVFVGHSQGGGDSTACLEKLLPCQAYLKAPAAAPASCCVPLKQIVTNDAECLCAVFNNPVLLKTFNVTQEDGLNLAKSCGAHADTSLCAKASAPSPSPNGSSAANSSISIPPPPSPLPTHKKNGAASRDLGGFLSAVVISCLFVFAI